ncbi:MAG: metallophosphoesterase [bacterium]
MEKQGLKAPLGVYGVLGNHDYWAHVERSRQEMKKAQIPLIENHAIWLKIGGAKIRLGGVGDLWEGTQDLQATMRDTKKNDFVLLLSHNPDYLELLPKDGPDLVLCGHTHGGQVTLFGLWGPFVPSRYGEKYRSGRREIKSGTAFISNGIGTVGPPIRLLAPPEILLITLKNPHTP